MNELKVKWPLIVKEFEKIYLNYIDLANYTMYRMCIFKASTPRLGLCVGIEDRGTYFFRIDKYLHKDYVAEKLLLEGDRGQVADFLNAQLQIECKQQGHYYEKLINETDPHGKFDEDKIVPWHPEIIYE